MPAPRHPLRGLALGVAAIAELLDRPAASLAELAQRLEASPRAVMLALRRPSIVALVIVDPDGSLRAATGATSATLSRRKRRALAPRSG